MRATKGYQPEGDLGEAKNKHLLPTNRAPVARIRRAANAGPNGKDVPRIAFLGFEFINTSLEATAPRRPP